MANKPTRIIFTGDVAFSKYFADGWKGDGCLSRSIVEFLETADFVVANIECPITNAGIELSNKKLVHVSDPRGAQYLGKSGIKYWNLSNNHIMDCGDQGLLDTMSLARENGCITLGAGENLAEACKPVILGDEVKIGIFSVTEPFKYLIAGEHSAGTLTWDKTKEIQNIIEKLKKDCDWIVAIAHGGDEFCNLPMPYIRDQYMALLKMGADLVVAHHPHVVQNYERFGKKVIYYSLGNFIFDTDNQRCYSYTDKGVLARIDFDKDSYSAEYCGVGINRKKAVVEKDDIPPIFTEIDERNYRMLWPLEACRLYPIDYKKRRFIKNDQNSSRFILFLKEIYILRKKRKRTLLKGSIISLLRGWKKSDYKDVVHYIRNSWSTFHI